MSSGCILVTGYTTMLMFTNSDSRQWLVWTFWCDFVLTYFKIHYFTTLCLKNLCTLMYINQFQ